MSASEPASAGRLGRFFFLKTTFATLCLLLLMLGGYVAYDGMIKENFPDLAIGQAVVSTAWPGADAGAVEQRITNELERKLKGVKGLKRFRSASLASLSIVGVEFRPDVDIESGLARLRAAVDEASSAFPRQAEKPAIQQVSVNDTPVITLALTGDVDIALLAQVAGDLKRSLERIRGVNKVTVAGDREEIVRIRLIGARLSALGLSPLTVRDAILAANIDAPWGEFEGDEIGATFRLLGRYRTVRDLERLPVSRASNRIVRLGEVAEIRRDLERETTRAALSWNGSAFRTSVSLSITKLPGADTIAVVDRLRATIADAAAGGTWPTGIDYRIVSNQAPDIADGLSNVFSNGWQAMLAVFVILFIALTWREAIIAGLAIPITFAGALLVLWALGFTLNQMVLIGMVLALGLLVDVFILMMEGMHENIYVRQRPFAEAALATIRTYSMPALAGQLTTILAMTPLLAIGGLAGKFIRIMPVTAVICLVLSLFVALFLCIPLSRWLLARGDGAPQKTWIDRQTERASGWLEGLLSAYFVRTKWHAVAWPIVAVVILVVGGMLFARLPITVFPKTDGRPLGVLVEMEPETSLASAQRCAAAVGEVLRARPVFESVTKLVGTKSPFSINSIGEQLAPSEAAYIVGFSAVFTPRSERDLLAYQYLPELRGEIVEAMAACPGGELVMTPQTGGASTEDPVQIAITGNDLERLRRVVQEVRGALASVKGTSDVRDNLGPAKLDVRASPKREALDFYNVATRDLAEQIRLMMTDDEIGKFARGGVEGDLKIRLGFAWPSRSGDVGGPTTVLETYLLQIINRDGTTVPLQAVVDFDLQAAPLAILHVDGDRTVTVSAKTSGRTATEILGDVSPQLEAMQRSWPAGFSYRFAGEAEESAETFGSAGVVFLIALVLVFSLLVIQFDSFLQPVIIMSAVPLALTGTFFTFAALSEPFSFMAMVGIIALIGIVVNDTIVMIETMNGHIEDGAQVPLAAARGAADRLRPILTTSITTIVGLTPLALSDPMWWPLCLAIISGLAVATVMSLLIVPGLYVLLTRRSAAPDR